MSITDDHLAKMLAKARGPAKASIIQQIRTHGRGRALGDGTYRNFCCDCGLPMVITHVGMRYLENLRCASCTKTDGRSA